MTNKDLASLIAVPCYDAISRSLFVGFDKAEGAGHPLNQLQQIAMVSAALACADGLSEELRGTFAFDSMMRDWAADRKAEEDK